MTATIDDAVYHELSQHAGLAALVSDRIYPDELPEGCIFPAVRFGEASLAPTYSHDGDSNLDATRMQFDCYAATRTGARAVANQVRNALTGHKMAYQNVAISSGFAENALSGYDDGLQKWRYIIDITLQYSQ
jgi:hypothetical protein